jgi:hypothetical protein
MDTALLPPHDPRPLDPHHAHVVDGAHLALRWARAEGAERYRVQVALDPGFYEVVFEQDVPGAQKALLVPRPFPEDDRTFYWRALAGNAHGWSEGARIESFISGSAAQVGRFADPDEAEPLGPVAALFRTATREALADVRPGHPHPARAEPVETSEVLLTEWLFIVVAMLLLAAVVLLLVSIW